MKLETKSDKILAGVIALCVVIIIAMVSIKFIAPSIQNGREDSDEAENQEVVDTREFLYGICIDSLHVTKGKVASRETISVILDRYGISQAEVNRICAVGEGTFDARQFRAGNSYAAITNDDSEKPLQYFVYEMDVTDFIVFDLRDTVKVTHEQKNIERLRQLRGATIESSLWNAMVASDMNTTLAVDIENVYQWSIDFYGLQKGDGFKVIYDELIVEGESIGNGTIYGAWFDCSGKRNYAIAFSYTDDKSVVESGYWDEEGKSLKSQFLKAPLKYSRISSRFSPSRMHPVLRIRRPHLGVDYAAPSGTPVHAIADGVITARAYAGGNGNYIKIKHAQNYSSGYLHLRGFAKGISVGTRVKQGDLIGYVGSTGISTGPHLDFRLWKGSTAIDPLKLENVKREDLPQKYMAEFSKVRDRIMAELDGKEYIESIETDSLATDSLAVVEEKK
ncbi:MAG: peptidoglycan DD-metalloendopeptidase family protein [Rikenellaceae bacterium]